jgi:hypothetical protein
MNETKVTEFIENHVGHLNTRIARMQDEINILRDQNHKLNKINRKLEAQSISKFDQFIDLLSKCALYSVYEDIDPELDGQINSFLDFHHIHKDLSLPDVDRYVKQEQAIQAMKTALETILQKHTKTDTKEHNSYPPTVVLCKQALVQWQEAQ